MKLMMNFFFEEVFVKVHSESQGKFKVSFQGLRVSSESLC